MNLNGRPEMAMITTGELVARETARVFENASEMQQLAPALFAQTAHPKMSERYSFTNTYDILLHIHNRGWRVASVMGGQKKFSKVIVRMRHADIGNVSEAPELVIVDSHDGTSQFKMFLGVIRFICMNGMIAGNMVYSRGYVHLAPDLKAQIMLDIEDIQPYVKRLETNVAMFKERKTTIGERIAIADAAVKARFGDDRPSSFILQMRDLFLQRRRMDDNADDFYTVMNVVQENALRGGMHYAQSGSVRRASAISNVDRNVHINRAVWDAANDLVLRAA